VGAFLDEHFHPDLDALGDLSAVLDRTAADSAQTVTPPPAPEPTPSPTGDGQND